MAIDKPQGCESTATRGRRSYSVDLYGGIAALGFVNGHLFLSSATKICPNFSNQTTMFLEKNTDLCLPTPRGSCSSEISLLPPDGPNYRDAQICLFFQKSGCLIWKIRANFCCRRQEKMAVDKLQGCESTATRDRRKRRWYLQRNCSLATPK